MISVRDVACEGERWIARVLFMNHFGLQAEKSFEDDDDVLGAKALKQASTDQNNRFLRWHLRDKEGNTASKPWRKKATYRSAAIKWLGMMDSQAFSIIVAVATSHGGIGVRLMFSLCSNNTNNTNNTQTPPKHLNHKVVSVATQSHVSHVSHVSSVSVATQRL